jgi:hypothetical protein
MDALIWIFIAAPPVVLVFLIQEGARLWWRKHRSERLRIDRIVNETLEESRRFYLETDVDDLARQVALERGEDFTWR